MLTHWTSSISQLFPNVNLMDVHGTNKQIFKAEIAYTPHELLHPHPTDPQFGHCNILGVD
jgi:hypothetical protein